MRKIIFLILLPICFISCGRKKLEQKTICEEVNCVEEVKVEPRRHSRW